MNQFKSGISAFVPAYNEEKRISFTLQSLIWCSEVILVDKNSSDRTVEIAKTFSNVKVLYQGNTEAYTSSEFEIFLNACQYKYCMIVTCSDIIHPALAFKIKALVETDSFDYDAIKIPYKGYFLGIYEKYSPWYTESSVKIVKTSLIKIKEKEVHTACSPSVNSIYEIKSQNQDEFYYHLTHESADGIMDRHIRYWKGEAVSPEPLSISLNIVIRKTIRFLFIKRTFFKGQAAIALAFSYLSYYMISYVYKWDHLFGNAESTYLKIREDISSKWNLNR